jgi:hypothetical protein
MKRVCSFAVLAVLASPAFSQEPRHDEHGQHMSHMQQMEQMMAPMMGAMAYAPDHLLSRKDSLGLTAQQVTRLTALRDGAKAAHDAAAADAKAHMGGVAAAMRAAAPDTAGLKMHFDAAHAAMGKAHWAMLAAAAQARALLSDEQRARVERWASRMMEREHH